MNKKTMMGRLSTLLLALALVWGGVACDHPGTPVEKTYKITFDSNGGSDVPAVDVVENTPATKPEDPTKPGYTFAGWFNGDTAYIWDTPVTSELNLTAKWNAIEYTITYLPDGITSENLATYTIDTDTFALTDPTNAPDPTKPNFVKWHLGQKPEEGDWTDIKEIVKGTIGNLIIVAEFSDKEQIKITITGDLTKEDKVSKGEPFKGITGYDLFYEDGTPLDTEKAVDAPLTLTAKAKEYTVKFNSDGGSDDSEVKVKYNNVVTKPDDPTKEGFTFKGWYNGETAFDFTTKVTKDITLKAKWEEVNVEKPTIPTNVPVTKKEDGLYSFANGTYKFVADENGNYLPFSMPEELVCEEGYQLKLSGVINFGETPIYQQLHIRTNDKHYIPLFGDDCNMVTSWGSGFTGDTSVNASVKIPEKGYKFKDCKFLIGAPLDDVEPSLISVTFKDVTLSYEKIDENAGVELTFKCVLQNWGSQGTCKILLPEPIVVKNGESYTVSGDVDFGTPSSGNIVQLSIQETKKYSVVEKYGIIEDYNNGLAGLSKSFSATWQITSDIEGEYSDLQFVLNWDSGAVGDEICTIKVNNFKITKNE